jgi:hypothetical protein
MHRGLDDVGHCVTCSENDRTSLDLAAIGHHATDRTTGGIERHRLAVEQAGATRHRNLEKPARQLHRVGIGGPR